MTFQFESHSKATKEQGKRFQSRLVTSLSRIVHWIWLWSQLSFSVLSNPELVNNKITFRYSSSSLYKVVSADLV